MKDHFLLSSCSMSASSLTYVFIALITVTAVAAGGAAAADGLSTATAHGDTVSPADVNANVTASETLTFSVSVNDSANGADRATGTLIVEDGSNNNVPADFPGTDAQFNAVAGDDDEIGTFDLVDAVEGAADDGVYNGVEFSTFDFVDIVDYNSQ